MCNSDDDDVSELGESDDDDDVDEADSGRFLRGEDMAQEKQREEGNACCRIYCKHVNQRSVGHHPSVRGREYSRVSPRLRGM